MSQTLFDTIQGFKESCTLPASTELQSCFLIYWLQSLSFTVSWHYLLELHSSKAHCIEVLQIWLILIVSKILIWFLQKRFEPNTFEAFLLTFHNFRSFIGNIIIEGLCNKFVREHFRKGIRENCKKCSTADTFGALSLIFKHPSMSSKRNVRFFLSLDAGMFWVEIVNSLLHFMSEMLDEALDWPGSCIT